MIEIKLLPALLCSALWLSAAQRPVLADYASIVTEKSLRRDGQKHLDTPAMLAVLKDLHVNTYIYLVHGTLDWNDMKDEFLPAAEKAGLDVWLYFLPPSECPIETCKLPWGHDYIRLQEESAKLSLLHKNLKGTAIDDFSDNVKLFTPEYTQKLRQAGRAVNPDFVFFPLLYTKSMNAAFLDSYAAAIDGVIWAYRDEPTINTHRDDSLRAQLTASEALLRERNKSLILMVYCSPLGRLPLPPSARYVQEAVQMGVQDAKAGQLFGVVTYKLEKGRTAPARENFAHSGNGRASLVASGRAYQSGDFAELSREIRVQTGSHSLRFSQIALYGKLPPGYFFLQVLIDDQTVWEMDLNRAVSNVWKQETVDLDAALRGKTTALVRLRLSLKRNAGSNQLITGFDDLEPEGFTLDDPGFETGEGWQSKTTNPGLMPLVQLFDPSRPGKMFDAVKQVYLEAQAK